MRAYKSCAAPAVAAALLMTLGPAARPAPAPAGADDRAPPEVLFKDLFVAVQTQRLYADGKEFVDAVANDAPEEILAQYHAQRPTSPESLRAFVAAHFTLPSEVLAEPAASSRVPIAEHIDRLWDRLTRSTPSVPPYASLLALPRPYVVPGGRFREMYYWDSYFTLLGLLESGRRDLVEDMVRNFAYLIDTYGHIPNGTRTYYLSRSQPPFFFAMIGLLRADDPAQAYARYLPQLQREYGYWMQGSPGLRPGRAHRRVVALPGGAILNRYWDDRDTPRDESYAQDVELARTSGRREQLVFRDIRAAAESGWDFSTRWFADPTDRASIDTTELVPSDLNSLLFGLENAIRLGCERKSDTSCARRFAARAALRRVAIDRYLWDSSAGAYLDYRWTHRERIARVSAATLYPLFVGLASDDQAAAVARTVARELLEAGGIAATPLVSGQQWDSPNGWAPLQWIAISGLRKYAQTSLAETIACRWMLNVGAVYTQSGRLVEKYDVIDTQRKGGGGEYPTQDGFGWTNGVMRKLESLYPADAAHTRIEQCPNAAPGGASHETARPP
jgi:alpha,alpha-trehalase